MKIFEAEWPDCWKPFSATEWQTRYHADTCLSLTPEMLHTPDPHRMNLGLDHVRLLPATDIIPEVKSLEPRIHTIIRGQSWNDGDGGWEEHYYLVIQSYYATQRIIAEVDDGFMQNFLAEVVSVHHQVVQLLRLNDLGLLEALNRGATSPWRASTNRKLHEAPDQWLTRVRSDAVEFALRTAPNNLFATHISLIKPDHQPR